MTKLNQYITDIFTNHGITLDKDEVESHATQISRIVKDDGFVYKFEAHDFNGDVYKYAKRPKIGYHGWRDGGEFRLVRTGDANPGWKNTLTEIR